MCGTLFRPARRLTLRLPSAFAGLVEEPRPVAAAGVERPPDPARFEARSPAGWAADWHLATALAVERPARRAVAGAGRRRRWLLGCLLMIPLLFAQLLLIQRDELAMHPPLRPALELLCGLAGCELPLFRQPEQLRLLQATISDHPEEEGALLATGVLVNNAAERQPYPLLHLALLDGQQNVVGERTFHPGDYLADPALRETWRHGMQPGRRVALRFALRDPGSGSAQYRFELR